MDEAERAKLVRVMHVARNLRPQDFQPWDEKRPLGFTLKEALYALVPASERGMVSSYLARVDGGIEGQEAVERMQFWLWHMLREQLRHGKLIAKAHRGDSQHPETIAPGLFDDCQPNVDAGSLNCGGTTLSGVRISALPGASIQEAEVPSPQSAATLTYKTGSPGRPTSAQLYFQEMLERHARGELAPTVTQEAAYLSSWLSKEHPQASPATPSTVENKIRQGYRPLKPPPKR